MESVSFRNVELTDGFWKSKQELNRKITIYAVRDRFKDTGRFDAFKCDWKEGMPNKPHFFWDSDVAKWIEGAANIIEKTNAADLEAEVDSLVDEIEKNQGDDGYFNIYFTVVEPGKRFTNRSMHELYCAGHLIEAAVAYYRATGKDKFLKLMCKYADYIKKVFLDDDSAEFTTPGHEEIELALVKLWRCTGERRYLELAKFFVDKRGNNEKDKLSIGMCSEENLLENQSHLPVRKQESAEGHCVRACYLYSAMADIAKEYNDVGCENACEKIFDNIVNRRMYITGGIGPSHILEAFTVDYDLPNQHAYAETCAAISLAFFAQRLLALKAMGKYADIVEKAFFNGMLSGISLDGKSFFYENPLMINPSDVGKNKSVIEKYRERFPITQRVGVFDCSCCPPNLNRVLSSLGDYVYGIDGDVLFVNQYMASIMRHENIFAEIKTDYPHSGLVKIRAVGVSQIALRVPAWCETVKIDADYEIKDGYAYINNSGEQICAVFEMKPVLMRANTAVQEDGGKCAMMYGPLVYCIESVDNGEYLSDITLRGASNATVVFSDELGANVIYADAYRHKKIDALYAPVSDELEKIRLKFIPYYAFANRGEAEMRVWINE